MAEVAAGALVAEQVVATGVEAAAVVAVASPTQPLKVSLTQLASPGPSDSSLARSHHTITTIGDTAYIFGGENTNGDLCSNDVHAVKLPSRAPTTTTEPKHDVQEPFPLADTLTGELLVPQPRKQHAACARGQYLIIHGGLDGSGNPIEEDNCLWLYDTSTLRWSKVSSIEQLGKAMPSRYGHSLFHDAHQDFLVLHGGRTSRSIQEHPPPASVLSDPGLTTETETWLYDFNSHSWTELPRAPASPIAASYIDTTLVTISASKDNLSGTIHYLRLLANSTDREKPGALKWESVVYPTNPLTPGPHPRADAVLVPLATGHGRFYIVYMFGRDGDHFYSDIWTLQMPSHGFTAAAAKDKIRDKLPGMHSGAWSWASVDLVPTEQMAPDGKVHPGPRALLAADSCLGGQGVVLWGGENPKGEKEGDGWILGLAYGYADEDRWE